MTTHDVAPEFSVVVGLISGRTADLAECLKALRGQANPPAMEILVPYDDPCADVTRLKADFPEVAFLACRWPGLGFRPGRGQPRAP